MFSNRHNNYDDYYGPNTPGMEYSSTMATVSVVFAFLAIFGSLMFYIAIPCGALSILFALLSRGGNKRVMGKCRLAVIVSAAGILLSIIMTVSAVHMVLTDPQMRRQLEYTFNYYAQELGLDMEFDDYFGGDGNDAIEPDNSDEERANDYFRRFLGNGEDKEEAPGDNGAGIPGGSDTSPGNQAIPSGGNYI